MEGKALVQNLAYRGNFVYQKDMNHKETIKLKSKSPIATRRIEAGTAISNFDTKHSH